MMVPLIQAVLQDSADIRALLGNPVRAWPGSAPAGTPLPYVTWTVVGGSPLQQLSDPPPADGWRVRINVWGANASQANAVAVAIRTEVERHGSIESYNPTPDDEDTGDFGISFDARLIYFR